MEHTKVPDRVKETIDNYVAHRFKPGGFVTSVLANDLESAIARADLINLRYIADIVSYVATTVPTHMRGSYEIVVNYLNGHFADEQKELERLKNYIRNVFEDKSVQYVAFDINKSSYKLHRSADFRTYEYVFCLDKIIGGDDCVRITANWCWEKLVEDEFNKK